MKIKITRFSQNRNRVLYDGPFIEYDYPEILGFFKIVANSKGYGGGVKLRFGYLNTEREKIEINCELNLAETIKMHSDLVNGISALIAESQTDIKAEVQSGPKTNPS